MQGALYGGFISLILVVFVGIMALLKNGEVEPLPLQIDTCECLAPNSTMAVNLMDETNDVTTNSPAIYRISYMWYSFLGCALTILLGLFISTLTESLSKSKVMSIVEQNERYPKIKGEPTIFTVETYRRKSQIHQIHPIQLHGIDNAALKIEE